MELSEIKGRIHSVETFGAVDGPGIRYVLFVQGCAMRCLYCHNPDSWDRGGGNEITAGEVAEDVGQYLEFIRDGGFTISGGEPLLQPEFSAACLSLIKEKYSLHTALDTAGSVALEKAKPVIDAADMLLLDIKTADRELHKRLTGRTIDNTLAILNYCEEKRKSVIIRHVLVPGLTLEDERIRELGRMIRKFRCIEKTELLPFHKMGEFKWKNLGEDYTLGETSPPTEEEVERARNMLGEALSSSE